MIKSSSLSELYEHVITASENEWVYANIELWNESPQKCEYFIISEEETDEMPDEEVYESDAGPYLPISLQHLNLYPWMELATLKGVVENLKMAKKGFDEKKFILGINYYRENDDFMDG
jgi:hypothetical protein